MLHMKQDGIGVPNCIGVQRRSFIRAAFLLIAKGVTTRYALPEVALFLLKMG